MMIMMAQTRSMIPRSPPGNTRQPEDPEPGLLPVDPDQGPQAPAPAEPEPDGGRPEPPPI